MRSRRASRRSAKRKPQVDELWEVPYLPIDPADVGRTYEAVIRVNSQSGKGGIAFLLERDYGLALPRLLQIEFSQVIQRITDATGKELSAAEIRAAFDREYVMASLPIAYLDHRAQHAPQGTIEQLTARLAVEGARRVSRVVATALWTLSSQAVRDGMNVDIHVHHYHEHGVGAGEDATAVAYVQLRIGGDCTVYGVGLDPNIVTATLKAVISGVNRAVAHGLLSLQPPPGCQRLTAARPGARPARRAGCGCPREGFSVQAPSQGPRTGPANRETAHRRLRRASPRPGSAALRHDPGDGCR